MSQQRNHNCSAVRSIHQQNQEGVSHHGTPTSFVLFFEHHIIIVATRAKAAVVSDPGRSSPSITPVITALKVTDTTVVCARTGSLVSLEAFDLKGMTTIFSYTRDSMENVVDVDFDELKVIN